MEIYNIYFWNFWDYRNYKLHLELLKLCYIYIINVIMLNNNRGHVFNYTLQLHRKVVVSIFLDFNQSVCQTSIMLFHENKLCQIIIGLLVW
jgi:hypothetical protein